MLIRLPELPRVFELYKGRMTSYVLRKCAWCEIARKIDSLSLSCGCPFFKRHTSYVSAEVSQCPLTSGAARCGYRQDCSV